MFKTIINLLRLQSYILREKPHINMWTYHHDQHQNFVNVTRGNDDIGIGGCIIGVAAFCNDETLNHNDMCWKPDNTFDWPLYIRQKFPRLSPELIEKFFGYDAWIVTEVQAAMVINNVIVELISNLEPEDEIYQVLRIADKPGGNVHTDR